MDLVVASGGRGVAQVGWGIGYLLLWPVGMVRRRGICEEVHSMPLALMCALASHECIIVYLLVQVARLLLSNLKTPPCATDASISVMSVAMNNA